jgi:hypothetical protein
MLCNFSSRSNTYMYNQIYILPLLEEQVPKQVSFYSFVPDSAPLASVKQVAKQVPQSWCLNIKYLHVQYVNTIYRLSF